MELGKWTRSELMPEGFPPPVARRLDLLEAWLRKTTDEAKQRVSVAYASVDAQTRDTRLKVAKAVECVPWVSELVGGEYKALWESGGRGAASYQSAMVSTSYASDDGRAHAARNQSEGAAAGGENHRSEGGCAYSAAHMHRCASSEALSAAPPPIVRHDSSQKLYPLTFRGW